MITASLWRQMSGNGRAPKPTIPIHEMQTIDFSWNCCSEFLHSMRHRKKTRVRVRVRVRSRLMMMDFEMASNQQAWVVTMLSQVLSVVANFTVLEDTDNHRTKCKFQQRLHWEAKSLLAITKIGLFSSSPAHVL